MSAFKELLGDKILTKDGEKDTAKVLGGKKYVLLYFSAHWCPPCRRYTPELSKAYSESSKAGKEVAIVFISSDQNETSFKEYYGSMSFHALPFANRDAKAALASKYGVRGIPTLVLLDGEGKLVEGNVRGAHAKYL